MRRRFSLEFFRIALTLLVLYTSMVAWQGDFTLKVDVSLIPLDVAVYDAQGNAVKQPPNQPPNQPMEMPYEDQV